MTLADELRGWFITIIVTVIVTWALLMASDIGESRLDWPCAEDDLVLMSDGRCVHPERWTSDHAEVNGK